MKYWGAEGAQDYNHAEQDHEQPEDLAVSPGGEQEQA